MWDRSACNYLVHPIASLRRDFEIPWRAARSWDLEMRFHCPDRDQIGVGFRKSIPRWSDLIFERLLIGFERSWNGWNGRCFRRRAARREYQE